MNQFTRTTTRGVGGRVVDSIKGIFVGIILFVIAFPLLWWNEGRAVQTAKSLEEGEARVVHVDTTTVDPANAGKLVHVSGDATTTEQITDDGFGVSAAALRLLRRVEMYQWVEDKKTETRSNVGGSETKTTTYTYTKKWSDTLVDSANFDTRAGHENPQQMRVQKRELYAKKAKLGAFDLPQEVLAKIDKLEPLPVDSAVLANVPADLRADARLDAQTIYLGKDPKTPDVGDARISFAVVRSPYTMSLIAQQTGTTFGEYQTKAGDKLLRLEAGVVDAKTMFKQAEEENAQLTWILRGVGWFLMTLGLTLIVRPIAVVASIVPFAGSLVSVGAFFVSALLAAGFSLITMAVAWIFYRPVLAGLIFAGAAAGLVGAIALMVRSRRARARV